jgi:hypothetical protein
MSPSRAALPPGKEPKALTVKGADLGPRDSLGVIEEREIP